MPMIRLSVPTLALAIGLVLSSSSTAQELTPARECLRPIGGSDSQKSVTERLQENANRCRAAARSLRQQAAEAAKNASLTVKVAPTTEVTNTSPTALEAAEQLDNLADVLNQKERQVQAEEPYFPIGKHGSLTYTVFAGLLRLNFKSKTGTTDKFEPLAGLGSGLKFSYSGLDNANRRIELLGVGLGFYFEPKVKVSGQDDTAQTMSAILVLSSLSKFYVGMVWKFASTEPGYSRTNGQENFGMVFGGGFDGSML